MKLIFFAVVLLIRNDVFCFRDKVLVCPMKSAPVLLTLSDSKHVVLPVDDDSDLNVVAAFDRRGEYIYTGNAKGKVSLFVGLNFTHSAYLVSLHLNLKVELVALFVATVVNTTFKLAPSPTLNATRRIVACTYTACTYTASYIGILNLF